MVRLPAVALAALLLALACGHGAGRGSGPGEAGDEAGDEAAREVLGRFARAVEAGRFAEAYPLLSDRWRAVYTPARLASDGAGAGPVARDAAARVLALLEAGARLEGDGPRRTLPIGGDRAAAVVAERDGWRVDALE